MRKKLREYLAPTANPYQSAMNAGVAALHEVATWEAGIDALSQPGNYDESLEMEWRRIYASIRCFGARQNDRNGIEAIACSLAPPGANFHTKPANSLNYQNAIRRYRRLALVEKLGVQAKHHRVPSINDPLAAALIDSVAAIVEADEVIMNQTVKRERCQNCALFLTRYANAFAIMLNIGPDRAFEFLSGNSSTLE